MLALQDSVYVLASAIKEMISNETIAEAPKDCGDSAVNWESGKSISGLNLSSLATYFLNPR